MNTNYVLKCDRGGHTKKVIGFRKIPPSLLVCDRATYRDFYPVAVCGGKMRVIATFKNPAMAIPRILLDEWHLRLVAERKFKFVDLP